ISTADREFGASMSHMAMAEHIENTGGVQSAASGSQAIAQKAASDYQVAQSKVNLINDTNASTSHLNKLGEKRGQEDAVELRFTISSPRLVADAQALVRVRVRTDQDGYRDFSFRHTLGALGPQPRELLIKQDGLPPGCDFVEARLHVFHHGEELATNLSERDLGLTATEAREYLLLDHLAQNPDATLPAQPAWALAPAALRTATDPAAFDFAAEVDIDAEGRLTAVRPAAN